MKTIQYNATFKKNKKSNWLQVSANKLLGDQSGGIKMSD